MKLRISVDNKEYEVEVDVLEDDEAAPRAVSSFQRWVGAGSVSSAGVSPGRGIGQKSGGKDRTVEDESKVCRSPVMGIVVRLNVHPGQDIHQEDPLLVLEAMKMESSIASPADGKIKEVLVKPGDSVEKDQVLVVFE